MDVIKPMLMEEEVVTGTSKILKLTHICVWKTYSVIRPLRTTLESMGSIPPRPRKILDSPNEFLESTYKS